MFGIFSFKQYQSTALAGGLNKSTNNVAFSATLKVSMVRAILTTRRDEKVFLMVQKIEKMCHQNFGFVRCSQTSFLYFMNP